jgi:D-alanyl-lipoteichoic acid acyltransferase DltB (MBOAT superfamily)
MLFNSFEFLIYLPLVFLLYWFVFKPLKWQNLFILVASYIFYGWWNWTFLILIAFTSFCSFLSGLLIQKYDSWGKVVSGLNIVVNLCILGIYKYYDFFVESFYDVFQSMGITMHISTLNLILPVGISFYTFQALSYTIDVYRKKIPATKDVIAFFAFISFFPQLVAGPIERATSLLPQFLNVRTFDYAKAVDGMRQILWGLFKKMVVADNCAVVVNDIFADYSSLSGPHLWVGAIFFTFQIYGDFSGYSDIAIGTAKLFGVQLMRNFNVPYLSRNIAEFWKRWHISLNTWFVDYIYIPLGGSRVGMWKTMRNTLVVFLVSGLWHGANWTFVVWGGYHALLFLPLLFIKNHKFKDTVAMGKLLPSCKEFMQISLTFFLVIIGWVIFRAENIHDAGTYLMRMFTEGGDFPKHDNAPFIYIVILCLIEWIQRNKEHGLKFSSVGILKYTFIRWSIYLIIFISTFLLAGQQEEFIYFQF